MMYAPGLTNPAILSCRWLPALAGVGLSFAVAAQPALDLSQAERLAVATDPAVTQLQASASALGERAIAAGQLPDPKLKLAAAALPVDTFDLDQEPMTQLQLGLQQRFPPGKSRQLRQRQMQTQADAVYASALDQQQLTLRAVREDFIEVVYQDIASAIIADSRPVFAELLEVTRDQFGSGRSAQQDVFRAELELSRVDDRALRTAQGGAMARAQLAVWIGDAAYRPTVAWPDLVGPESLAQVLATLHDHPRLQALRVRINAAETGVDVARENYKPGWMLDLTYGDRSGQNINGSARSNFLFAAVTIDLPLFRAQRQDRQVAAAAQDVNAQLAQLANEQRQLERSAEREWAALQYLRDRLQLFDQHLLPDAAANSAAAMDAYESGSSEFSALARARITEFQLQIDHARAVADELRTRARLLYLLGDEA